MLNDETLFVLNDKGLILGPSESSKTFSKRIKDVKNLPFQNKISESDWAGAQNILKEKFGMRPAWIEAFYSDENLSFWEGAAMWNYQLEDEVEVPFIQLKKRFIKGSYLFYSRNEVLAHEAIHAIRIGFEKMRFEEIFAYSTSKNRFRRWFGPLFRSAKETRLFIIFLSLITITSLFYPSLIICSLFPFIYYGIRLCKDHWLLKKALKKIKQLFGTKNPLAIAVHLTDREIDCFAFQSLEKLRDQINQDTSLRWRQILLTHGPLITTLMKERSYAYQTKQKAEKPFS